MSERTPAAGTVLVTGGAGFIGSNLVRFLLAQRPWRVASLDNLSYAGSGQNLEDLSDDPRYAFYEGDIADLARVRDVVAAEQPWAIFHLAAESHVDRSILAGAPFLRTNIEGTRVMLDVAREAGVRRFLYVSTDEVYGDLGPEDPAFTEETPLSPSSPYSVSKAGGDMLASAYHRTYGLDVVITRCSNNYGPYQFPEKLIPLMITNALAHQPLPVYGDGSNVRDWIHTDDHCRGLVLAVEKGAPGAAYNLGGLAERRNLEVVERILDTLERPRSLIRFVTDRPGHDRRYAIDCTRAQEELGWRPERRFDEGLTETCRWYVEHQPWWERLKDQDFQSYYRRQYPDLFPAAGPS